jgi:SAM-dependent methyltransferase
MTDKPTAGCDQAHLDSYSPRWNDVGYASAEVVVPLLVGWLSPASAIDVGCGPGNWVLALRAHGIKHVLGIDQNDYGADLRIPREQFVVKDLSTPLDMADRFDLAICLEVAEHLQPSAAPVLVQSLTRLAPVVLFSAAIPFQGGTDHRNEQWPEFWEGLFAANGFASLDCVRPRIWADERVAWWYRQNTVLYVRHGYVDEHAPLKTAVAATPRYPLAVVHPSVYLRHVSGGRKSSVRTRVLGRLGRLWRRE